MDRRDFLLFKTRGRLRVAELSCERLYMRALDARLARAPVDSDFDPAGGGEPPTDIEPPTRAEVIEGLGRGLSAVDVVRVTEAEWLGSLSGEWRAAIEGLLEGVRGRGGRVEVVASHHADETAPTEAV